MAKGLILKGGKISQVGSTDWLDMPQLFITGTSAGAIPLTVNAITGQTAKIQSWLVNSVEKAYVDNIGQVIGYGFYGTPSANLRVGGQIADGASAVGVVLDNTVALTTAGSRIISFRNAGVEKAYLDKDGVFYTAGNISAAGTIAAGGVYVATQPYVQSRGQNLITNGTGLLANNYNFTSGYFSGSEAYGSAGSFYSDVLTQTFVTDEFLPVDPGKFYELRLWAKVVTAAAVSHAYFGGSFYDVDKLQITPECHMFLPGTHTTLAAPLKVGDTTITLASSANWHNGATTYQRQAIVWGYKNSFGYKYPAYTYSRFNTLDLLNGTGSWNAGGISGNVITLVSPWPAAMNNPDDPTNGWPVGTPISNANAGGTFKYFAASNVALNAAWTEYRGTVGGLDLTGSNDAAAFPPGSAYMKVLALLNRDTAAVASRTYMTNVWFSETTSLTMLNPAGDASAGTTVLSSQTLTLRSKYWNGSSSVNYDAAWQHVAVSNAPSTRLRAIIAGSEVFSIDNGGGVSATGSVTAANYLVTNAGWVYSGAVAVPMKLRGYASATGSVGLQFGNTTTLTGSKIASFYSDNMVTERACINYDGGVYGYSYDALIGQQLKIGPTNATSLTLGKDGVPTNSAGAFSITGGGNNSWAPFTITGQNTDILYQGQVTNIYGYLGTGRYSASFNWQTPTTYASNIRFGGAGGTAGNIEFTTDTGLTANTNYTPTVRATITNSGLSVVGVSNATSFDARTAAGLTLGGTNATSLTLGKAAVGVSIPATLSVTGFSQLTGGIQMPDTRNVVPSPTDYGMTVKFVGMKYNGTGGGLIGSPVPDGSAYAGLVGIGWYSDDSAGRARGELAFTGAGNIYWRTGLVTAPSYNAWNKLVLATSLNADGSTAVAHVLDTAVAYSTPGAKLLSFRSNGGELAYVSKDGVYSGAGYYSSSGLFASTAATSIVRGGAADSASAVNITINTPVSYVTVGSKLLSIQNNGAEKAFINKDGGASFSGSVQADEGIVVIGYWDEDTTSTNPAIGVVVRGEPGGSSATQPTYNGKKVLPFNTASDGDDSHSRLIGILLGRADGAATPIAMGDLIKIQVWGPCPLWFPYTNTGIDPYSSVFFDIFTATNTQRPVSSDDFVPNTPGQQLKIGWVVETHTTPSQQFRFFVQGLAGIDYDYMRYTLGLPSGFRQTNAIIEDYLNNLVIRGNVNQGTTAVTIDTGLAFTDPNVAGKWIGGSKLLTLNNNGAEKLSFNYDGTLLMRGDSNPANTLRIQADDTHAGLVFESNFGDFYFNNPSRFLAIGPPYWQTGTPGVAGNETILDFRNFNDLGNSRTTARIGARYIDPSETLGELTTLYFDANGSGEQFRLSSDRAGDVWLGLSTVGGWLNDYVGQLTAHLSASNGDAYIGVSGATSKLKFGGPGGVAINSTATTLLSVQSSLTEKMSVSSTGVVTAASFTGAGTGLTGTAASLTAGAASTVTIANDTTTNANYYPVWATATTGNLSLKVTSTKLTFNPSTGDVVTTGNLIAGGNLWANSAGYGNVWGSLIGPAAGPNTVTLRGYVAAATTTGSVILDTATALTTAASKLISIRHATSEVAYFTKEGNLNLLAGTFTTTGTAATGALTVTGAITATGNITAYYSDARLKMAVRPVQDAMSKVLKLRGVEWLWDMDACDEAGFKPDTLDDVGVVAQEVQQVLPNAVGKAANPKYLAVKTSNQGLIALLIEAVKELKSEIEMLKAAKA